MNTRRLLFLLSTLATVLHAAPRSSTSYSVPAESTDGAGRRATSASYTNHGSAGGITGVSSVPSPSETARAGYIGQLYEVTALQLAATPATVNEGATRQLGAVQLLDDLTTIAIPAGSITWSVQSGPLSGISAGGLATAATVYQDTLATAQGLYAGNTGTLNLTVLNVNTDDLPGYAVDGLDDAWQVQYFGLGNPNAAPAFDPDFDGQDNLFEFTAGLSPVSAASRLLLQSTAVPNQPGQMNIVISPLVNGRTYTVKSSLTLGSEAVWTDLTSYSTSDNGSTRTITDLNATGVRKFYQVQVSKP